MGEHPFYRFFRRVSFPLAYAQWRRMPRHPSFKHEYWDGQLHWTPRPNSCDVYLDLSQWQPPPPATLKLSTRPPVFRQLQEEDWETLPRVFCAAANQWPPLSQWSGAAPMRAARVIMEWARRGKDGPLVPQACQVALDAEARPTHGGESIQGATIVTQVPVDRLRGAPPIADSHLPHLNWIFVSWREQRRGIGTRLLDAVVSELRTLGHRTLASTVLIGPPAPMLWHWSHGFRLPRDGW